MWIYILLAGSIILLLLALRSKSRASSVTVGAREQKHQPDQRQSTLVRAWGYFTEGLDQEAGPITFWSWMMILAAVLIIIVFGFIFGELSSAGCIGRRSTSHQRHSTSSKTSSSHHSTALQNRRGVLLVNARRGWQRSVYVRSDQRFTIRAWGKTYCSGGGSRFKGIPDGPNGMPRRHHRFVRLSDYPVPEANPHSLIARIGSGDPFMVGSGRTAVAARSGYLYLRINDYLLNDNHGKLSVKVTLDR